MNRFFLVTYDISKTTEGLKGKQEAKKGALESK